MKIETMYIYIAENDERAYKTYLIVEKSTEVFNLLFQLLIKWKEQDNRLETGK